MFKIIQKSKFSLARLGKLMTLHGTINTPFFMPIATSGAVKGLWKDDLEKIGAKIILANTFHLLLKPGGKILKEIGGLHNFMNWQRPILTDSGGYQVFSLAKIRKITDKGVEFLSQEAGGKIFLTPEKVLEGQKEIGSDIFMVLDHCPASLNKREEIEKAVERTSNWAKKSKEFFEKLYKKQKERPLVFGIVQGGTYEDLREKCLKDLLSLDFDGYAIGGLFLGEMLSKTFKVVELVSRLLPEQKPKYLMGAGYPEQLVRAVRHGIDMFDCVIPTRHARHGEIFVFKNKNVWEKDFYEIIEIKKSRYERDFEPLAQNCSCDVCKNFSRAYLRHIYKTEPILYQRLATLHNLKFYLDLMEKIKNGIKKGKI